MHLRLALPSKTDLWSNCQTKPVVGAVCPPRSGGLPRSGFQSIEFLESGSPQLRQSRNIRLLQPAQRPVSAQPAPAINPTQTNQSAPDHSTPGTGSPSKNVGTRRNHDAPTAAMDEVSSARSAVAGRRWHLFSARSCPTSMNTSPSRYSLSTSTMRSVKVSQPRPAWDPCTASLHRQNGIEQQHTLVAPSRARQPSPGRQSAGVCIAPRHVGVAHVLVDLLKDVDAGTAARALPGVRRNTDPCAWLGP